MAFFVNEYPMKGEQFYRTADPIAEMGDLSMHKFTQNSLLNPFAGQQ